MAAVPWASAAEAILIGTNQPRKDHEMFAANTYVIRHVEGAEKLAELDSQRPLTGPALIGEIDGRPAAAISLADGRVVADPFQPTAQLVAQLRMRARALKELERMPDLSDRLRAATPFAMQVAPSYWF